VTGREAVGLVARREITERIREKSFLVGTGVSLVIILLVTVLPGVLGFGGRDEYTVGIGDPRPQPSPRPPWPRATRSTRT
jgi:ABC-2 type transport system permease protein